MIEPLNDKNEIYVGIKPVMTYVQSIKMQSIENKEIKILARGKNINTAVASALLSMNYLDNWVINNTRIYTHNPNSKEFISSIEIILRVNE